MVYRGKASRSALIGAALMALTTLSPGLCVRPLTAQGARLALDHDDTILWNTIQDRALSPDGQWVTYVLSSLEGDPTLVVARTDGSGPELRMRGTAPAFTDDSRFVAFRIPPMESVVDSLKLEGERGDDLPKDSVGVVPLADAFAPGAPDGAGVWRAGPIESFEVREVART